MCSSFAVCVIQELGSNKTERDTETICFCLEDGISGGGPAGKRVCARAVRDVQGKLQDCVLDVLKVFMDVDKQTCAGLERRPRPSGTGQSCEMTATNESVYYEIQSFRQGEVESCSCCSGRSHRRADRRQGEGACQQWKRSKSPAKNRCSVLVQDFTLAENSAHWTFLLRHLGH